MSEWTGPPPSYYEPPDDRHCPECEEEDEGERCDDADEHRTCQYHGTPDPDQDDDA